MTFSINDFSGKYGQIRIWILILEFPADLVVFTEEILNVKLHFLRNAFFLLLQGQREIGPGILVSYVFRKNGRASLF